MEKTLVIPLVISSRIATCMFILNMTYLYLTCPCFHKFLYFIKSDEIISSLINCATFKFWHIPLIGFNVKQSLCGFPYKSRSESFAMQIN